MTHSECVIWQEFLKEPFTSRETRTSSTGISPAWNQDQEGVQGSVLPETRTSSAGISPGWNQDQQYRDQSWLQGEVESGTAFWRGNRERRGHWQVPLLRFSFSDIQEGGQLHQQQIPPPTLHLMSQVVFWCQVSVTNGAQAGFGLYNGPWPWSLLPPTPSARTTNVCAPPWLLPPKPEGKKECCFRPWKHIPLGEERFPREHFRKTADHPPGGQGKQSLCFKSSFYYCFVFWDRISCSLVWLQTFCVVESGH